MESKDFVLDQTTIKKLLTIYKLTIPDFQRNFVWKQPKKQQLLASLFRGFPIGAITLYDDNGVYYIIDGLQRINTLNQYLSRPSAVISFSKFWEKVDSEAKGFISEKKLTITISRLKKSIKKWYENLNALYEFEKVSVLYKILKNENKDMAEIFDDLQLVEELLEILKSKIEITHDDIALIIYKGNKNDLPELFKNINTGSVALSQYEILQSVWKDYFLNKNVLPDTFAAFNRELELIKNDYEIDAVREQGKFDIFKNIMGLNHMLCCKKDSNMIFRFSAFKRLPNPVKVGDGIKKYYENDSISFELYSTVLCNASNQIVKAVDLLYKKENECEKISQFINELNQAILNSVDIAIEEVQNKKQEMIESKYHSLYVLAGIILSKYDIDAATLTIKEIDRNNVVFAECLNLRKHIYNKWFLDENRQVGFFNDRIKDLLEMKKNKRDKV